MQIKIDSATGGNFENLVVDETPVDTVVSDNMSITTVVLGGPATAVEGETVTYFAALLDETGNPTAAQGDVTVNLSNGLVITILDGQTQGSVQYTVPDDAYVNAPPEITPPPISNLATLSDITANYLGAFKMPIGQYGTGTITVVPGTNRIFCDDSVVNNLCVFEAEIPALVNESADLNALNTAALTQPAVSLKSKLSATEWGNHGSSRAACIWGMGHDGEHLFVNATIGYDAAETGTETTIRVDDPNDLASTAVSGPFIVNGLHAAARWVAPIPTEYQAELGGDVLMGAGTGYSIVGRYSKGPSLFVANMADLKTATYGQTVPSIAHMNFKNKWMVDDYLNFGGASNGVNNDIYVTTSNPSYGFIIPGTRTYCVVGYSEGWAPGPFNLTQTDIDGYTVANAGDPASNPYVGTTTDFAKPNGAIAYKNNAGTWGNNRGETSNGYFCWDADNRGPYAWLFSLDDIMAAESVDDLLPYEWGPLALPFANPQAAGRADSIGGAVFDYVTSRLYLSLPFAQNNSDPLYPGRSVIAVYQF